MQDANEENGPMEKIIVSTAIALIGGLTFTTATSAGAELADEATPLRVKVATFDGKKKLKAAKSSS